MSDRIIVRDGGCPAYLAHVHVQGTLVENYAPFGGATPTPYFTGSGQTPEDAIRDAFEQIGRKVVKMAGDP